MRTYTRTHNDSRYNRIFFYTKNPRIERRKQHSLIDIIVLTLSTVASGTDGWDGMGWDGMGWDGMGWDTKR